MNKYLIALREHNVKKFIEEHGYAPSIAQINEMRDMFLKDHPNLTTYGFSGQGIEKIQFQEPLSSSKENRNREMLIMDSKVQKETAKTNYRKLVRGSKTLNKEIDRISNFLEKLESRINRLVLLNSKADMFLYGIEDTFNNVDNVDLERTTAHVEKGYICHKKDSLLSLKATDFTIRSFAKGKDIVSESSNGGFGALSKKDGAYYQHVVSCSSPTSKVKVNIEYLFKKKTYVGDIKITGNSIETNSKCYYSIEYATDEGSYVKVKPEKKRFSTGENFTSLGKTVKKVKIILEKNKADTIDMSKKLNMYLFTLDGIEFTSTRYEKNTISTAYLGPYPVFNEDGFPVNFSMATIANNTCCIVPDKTSVSFFLSKDGEYWKSAEYDNSNENSKIVKFSSVDQSNLLNLLEEDKEKFEFVNDDTVTETSLNEVIFNLYVKESDLKLVNLKNLRIERNLLSEEKVYDSKGGWFHDKANGRYSCGFYIDSIEGKIIDLGNTVAKIDGYEKSGVVRLDEGYHTFETAGAYWKDLRTGITFSKELEEEDELYPYNHKYLIEGYNYPENFSGEKYYNKVGRVFGTLMKYCPIEFFETEENDRNLSIYTIEKLDGDCYIKVKILEEDSSWTKEKNNIIVQGETTTGNNIYVKAILKNSDTNLTPHINSISIRVI